MGFAFKVATRFLKSSKSQTLFIILGIAIGVAVQVFVGTLITSLQTSLINRTIGSSPHITITSNDTTGQIDNWEPMMSKINGVSTVSRVALAVDGQAFISNFTNPVVLLLRGFDYAQANQIFKYNETIYEGSRPENDNETLIGKELQKELNLKLGDILTLNKGKPPYNVNYSLKITGFYDLGVASLNRLWAIVSNSTVKGIFNTGNNITSISIQVSDVFNADVIADQIKTLLEDENQDNTLKIVNWKSENAQLLSGLSGQTISSIMIQAFVLISVIIGISSVLAITVLQKSKQIGILKAMGINDGKAARIFLSEGFLLGLGGALIGVSLGLGLMYAFVTFAKGPDKKPIIDLYFDYGFIALSAFIALLASMGASLIPARRSSKLNVIEVIRNG